MIRSTFCRLGELIFRSRRERRLADEMQEHLDELTASYVAGGMSDSDARLAARRAFGNLDRIHILHREQRGLPLVTWLLFDLRSAVRVLGRDRLFTAGVVLVLALGLAVNTTIFTIVNGMTWRTLPVPDGDQIVSIESLRLPRRVGINTSFADFRDWRAAARTFDDLAAYRAARMNLGDESRPADWLEGNFVTSNIFRLLRMQPIVGRDFQPADDSAGANPVVMLAHQIWATRYGADPAIIGGTIRINGLPTTVIGVMPKGFQFPIRADAWRPLSQMPGLDVTNRSQRQLDVAGRLRDGIRLDQAAAELETIAAALAAQYPDTNTDVGTRIMPFTYSFVAPPPEAREPLVMMISAAIVLLIACANGANLLLARAAHRAREMAMRATLGASQFRIVRQLFVEALLIAAAAAVVGLLLSRVGVEIFTSETADMNLPFWIAFEFDARVFTFVAVACLGTSLAFGLAPAWHLSKTDAHDVLKDGGRTSVTNRRSRRWSGMLLVSELALTLTLLGAAAMLLRSSAALASHDTVLDLDNVLTVPVGLPPGSYTTPEERRALHARLQDALDRTGLPSATLSSVRPFVESNTLELELEGESNTTEPPRSVQAVGAGGNYFETLGIRILRGRALRGGDAAAGREAAVINERFADVYFRGIDPIGQRIRLTKPAGGASAPASEWFTVVGVSVAIRQQTMAGVAPVVYVPLDWAPGPVSSRVRAPLAITVRTMGDAERTTAAVREAVRTVDPDVAASNINSLRRLSQLSRGPARIVTFVLTFFALIASVLSTAGLYGMAAYGVALRTPEIGLRIALGASRSQIGWLFLRTTLLHVVVGLLLGVGGVLAVGQLIQSVMVQSAGADALVLSGIAAALATITALACVIPARRAMRLDPVAALRHE